jgi:hypothetical protein
MRAMVNQAASVKNTYIQRSRKNIRKIENLRLTNKSVLSFAVCFLQQRTTRSGLVDINLRSTEL